MGSESCAREIAYDRSGTKKLSRTELNVRRLAEEQPK